MNLNPLTQLSFSLYDTFHNKTQLMHCRNDYTYTNRLRIRFQNLVGLKKMMCIKMVSICDTSNINTQMSHIPYMLFLDVKTHALHTTRFQIHYQPSSNETCTRTSAMASRICIPDHGLHVTNQIALLVSSVPKIIVLPHTHTIHCSKTSRFHGITNLP
jgi:hypothetical protein